MRQDYKEIPLFPIRCWSFKAPSKLRIDTLEGMKKLEYRDYNADGAVGTSEEMTRLPQFYDIHEWFQHCVDTVHADNSWTCDRIVIISHGLIDLMHTVVIITTLIDIQCHT